MPKIYFKCFSNQPKFVQKIQYIPKSTVFIFENSELWVPAKGITSRLRDTRELNLTFFSNQPQFGQVFL